MKVLVKKEFSIKGKLKRKSIKRKVENFCLLVVFIIGEIIKINN
jgi:hypothetical protein